MSREIGDFVPEKEPINPIPPDEREEEFYNERYTNSGGPCPKCHKPYIYARDVPPQGYPIGCNPWCTCKWEEVTYETLKYTLKFTGGKFDFNNEKLKNKIYRLAYYIPKSHPDPKAEEMYDEIIESHVRS